MLSLVVEALNDVLVKLGRRENVKNPLLIDHQEAIPRSIPCYHCTGSKTWGRAMAANGEKAWAYLGERSSMHWALVIFAVGAGLWLLSYAEWLPAGLANILAPRPGENRAGLRDSLLSFAGFGLVLATLSYLRLRAYRLGTERAARLANVANMVFETAVVLVVVAVLGGILLLIGLIVGDWFTGTGRFERFPFGAISMLLSMVLLPFSHLASLWIDERAKTAGLKFAVIGLGALLAVHVTLAVFALWQWVQEIELPLWLASLISIPALGAAAFLVWGIVIAVRRFRAFTADRAS